MAPVVFESQPANRETDASPANGIHNHNGTNDTNGASGTNGVNNGKKDDHVDVLIVGSGPAGLAAATWMAQLGVKTRIVDKRGTKVFNGQADGMQSRTLEIFESWGFADKIHKLGPYFADFATWVPKHDNPDEIFRINGSRGLFENLSSQPSRTLHQGYVEKHFLEHIHEHSDIDVERGILPSALSIDESKLDDPKAYPLTIELTHLSETEMQPFQMTSHVVTKDASGNKTQDGMFRSNLAADDTDELISKGVSRPGSKETIHAKYMIGCEGAHSWTRRQLGFAMEGDRTDHVWGVMDIIPLTNFPDVRKGCTVQSPHGSCLVIPRENGLTRFYTQLAEIHPDETGFTDRSKITPPVILESCRKIFAPYTLDYNYCEWYAGYQIGQRLCDSFSAHNRIFLAGDAVHTHSPKAGQGMNVSIQDTHNLGWKIAGVIHGELSPSVLATYPLERRDAAHKLIEFDRKVTRLFSGKPTDNELRNVYFENANQVAGCAVHYPPSNTISELKPGEKDVAPGLVLGKRFPSRPDQSVCQQSDGQGFHLQSRIYSDGRWRLVVFAGNVADPAQWARVNALGDALKTPNGLLARYTHHSRHNKRLRHAGDNPTLPLFDVLTVHKSSIDDIEVTDFHPAFFPYLPETGYEYDKVFVDREMPFRFGGQFYEWLGVDNQRGCILAVRPDGYNAWKGEFEDLPKLEEWLRGCLIENPQR